MATEPTISRRETRRREPSLRPARWPGRPRVVSLLRGSLVAAFLALAAGLIYAQEPAPCADGAPSGVRHSGVDSSRAGTAGDRIEPGPARPASGAAADPPPTASAALPIPRGLVGVPIRLAEPAAAAAARPGARVDLLAVPAGSDGTTLEQPAVLASAALVLDVLASGDAPPALVLALESDQARRVVAQPESTRFAVILR